jgi:hypothetical protein
MNQATFTWLIVISILYLLAIYGIRRVLRGAEPIEDGVSSPMCPPPSSAAFERYVPEFKAPRMQSIQRQELVYLK